MIFKILVLFLYITINAAEKDVQSPGGLQVYNVELNENCDNQNDLISSCLTPQEIDESNELYNTPLWIENLKIRFISAKKYEKLVRLSQDLPDRFFESANKKLYELIKKAKKDEIVYKSRAGWIWSIHEIYFLIVNMKFLPHCSSIIIKISKNLSHESSMDSCHEVVYYNYAIVYASKPKQNCTIM